MRGDASSPVLRQVDALVRDFGWPFNQPVRTAFSLLGGQRRVEHASDLLDRAFLDIGRVRLSPAHACIVGDLTPINAAADNNHPKGRAMVPSRVTPWPLDATFDVR